MPSWRGGMRVLIAILMFSHVAGTSSSGFYHKHFLESRLNPQTQVDIPVVEYSWPPACAGRVMRKFDWVLNYELLNAIGAKWVCCLGRQGATGGFSTHLSALPSLQHRPAVWVNTGFEKQLLTRGSQSCAPVWHLACPCTVGYLPSQPFFFIAVFVSKLPGYSLLYLLIKIKLYFNTIWTLESWWLFLLLRICIDGQINIHRHVKSSC